MNKKIMALLLASCTLVSMAGCNSKKVEPSSEAASVITFDTGTSETSISETTAETTEETTEETTASEETATQETSETKAPETSAEKSATPTPKSIGKTTVTNAYSRTFSIKKQGKFTTKYPKVTIKGVSTSAINKEIADKFGPIAKKNDSVVKYSYYVGKNYVSIFVTVNLDAGKDGSNYYVYNVSRETGKKLSKAEMLKCLNMKDSAFKSKVTAAVKKWWNSNIPNYKSDKTSKEQYKKAIAAKSINSAVPYVNSKGKKCYLLRQMKAPTQMGTNDIYSTI